MNIHFHMKTCISIRAQFFCKEKSMFLYCKYFCKEKNMCLYWQISAKSKPYVCTKKNSAKRKIFVSFGIFPQREIYLFNTVLLNV